MLGRLTFGPQERADLHVHSSWSDGEHPPAALVARAARAGLGVIALTDHAEVDGIPEAVVAGAALGVHVVPGVEVNTASGDFLGLFVDWQDGPLRALLADLRARRARRLAETVDRLGMAFERPIRSRSDLAMELVRAGLATNADDAFDRYLGRRGRVWVPGDPPETAPCLEVLARAGALIVEAHPRFSALDRDPDQLRAWGVVAYELPPPGWPDPREGSGLLAVGGSNYHGGGRTAARLGLPCTLGPTLGALVALLPAGHLWKSWFKHQAWRSANLSPEEHLRCLQPRRVEVTTLHLGALLERPLPRALPTGRRPRFTLVGPGAVGRLGEVQGVLEREGASILGIVETDAYPMVAWDLYDMAAGPADQRLRDLLRFEGDRALLGLGASRGAVVWFEGGGELRPLKKVLRRSLGAIEATRVSYRGLEIIGLSTFVHLPDEDRIDLEGARLADLGLSQ